MTDVRSLIPDATAESDAIDKAIAIGVRDAARVMARKAQDTINAIAERDRERKRLAIERAKVAKCPAEINTVAERNIQMVATFEAGGPAARYKNMAERFGVSRHYVAQCLANGDRLLERWCRSEMWRHRREMQLADFRELRLRGLGPKAAYERMHSWYADE